MIGVLIVVAAATYLAACLLAGFGPAGRLADFEPTNAPRAHRYRQPIEHVMSTYQLAVSATPGAQLVQMGTDQMLIDMRPTSRVIGGNFGLVIRLSFRPDGAGGTRVESDSRNKAPFAWSNHDAAFLHAERALRTRAKRAGLDEIMQGLA